MSLLRNIIKKVFLPTIITILPSVVYGAVGTTPISKSVGDALGAFVASGNAPALLVTIETNIAALANQNERNRQLYNLAPELNGALTQMSQLTFIRGMNRISHRFDEFQEKTGTTENTAQVALSPDIAIWMQVHAHWAKQKDKGEFAGFHADASGIEIGIEKTFERQNKVGADVSFLSLGTDPRDFSTTENDIDNYQVDFYGNYDFENTPIYIEGNISTGYTQHHTRRHILAGGAQRDSKSSYHGWQAGTRAELGYMWGKEKIKISPVIGMSYVHTHFDVYRETSADNLNLQVQLEDTNVLRSTIGIRSVYEGGVYGDVMIMPSVYALWSHDFHRAHCNAAANFIAGGPTFHLEGLSPRQNGLEAGLSITLYNGHGFNYSTNYHYEYWGHYRTHSAWVKMRYEWA